MERHIAKIVLLLSVLLFASCEKLTIPSAEETESSATGQKVTIITRSSTNDIQYPLYVYAFDASGKCAAQQTLNSSAENLSLSLTKGQYRIIALSNTEGYKLPSSPSSTSLIEMAGEGNSSSSPLQVGQADVTVGGTSQTVNLTLSYKVSTLNITLAEVPSSVKSVKVTISSLYGAMDMQGQYSKGKNTTIDMQKSGNTWTTQSYVFPGSSSQTVFSISLTDDNGTTSYGYTYSAPLMVGTPYNISGKYSSDLLTLSASFLTEGWKAPIALNFNFGPGSSEERPSEDVAAFPKAGSMWNGHLVAYVYADDGTSAILDEDELTDRESVNLLLLSLNEWTGVVSANHEDDPEAAITIARDYTEGDLSGWKIPTSAEAKNLKSLYSATNETLTSLNATLETNGGTSIVPLDAKGENLRYLCEDATYTYAWKTSASLTKAGATVKYSLRLVNHVRVTRTR